ncbi:MAG: hypothetical protein U5R31_00620 [Acidimicrobiia bacterium]|nr:hypothetical protein [Acidimicrobiia bacterium]
MTTRTTFTLDDELAEQARRLGVNVSAAAAATASRRRSGPRWSKAIGPPTRTSPNGSTTSGPMSRPGATSESR